MIIFWCALIITVIGVGLFLTPNIKSHRFPTLILLRTLPVLDRVSLGFFLAALTLVAVDQVYWAFYWETPNYLSFTAAVGGLAGLLYLAQSEPRPTASEDDSSNHRRAEL